MKFTAKPSRPWYQRILMPLYLADAAKMLLPAVLIGVGAAYAINDVFPLILVVVVGYVGVLFIGRHLGEYEVPLRNQADFDYAVKLLDHTKALQRRENSLVWGRRGLPRMFYSKADQIVISELDSGWLVRGRKFDIRSLATALNARAEEPSSRELR